jgi:hypothetical protein
MADAGDLRGLALALDGATAAPHVDRTAFKVKRIFATLASDGATANLKLAEDEQALKCAVAPEAFRPVPGGWGRMGWTTVELGAVTVDELAEVLRIAWRHALPKPRRAR